MNALVFSLCYLWPWSAPSLSVCISIGILTLSTSKIEAAVVCFANVVFADSFLYYSCSWWQPSGILLLPLLKGLKADWMALFIYALEGTMVGGPDCWSSIASWASDKPSLIEKFVVSAVDYRLWKPTLYGFLKTEVTLLMVVLNTGILLLPWKTLLTLSSLCIDVSIAWWKARWITLGGLSN